MNMGKPGEEPRVYLMGDGSTTTEEMCPGVRAHPDTMIGRGGK